MSFTVLLSFTVCTVSDYSVWVRGMPAIHCYKIPSRVCMPLNQMHSTGLGEKANAKKNKKNEPLVNIDINIA